MSLDILGVQIANDSKNPDDEQFQTVLEQDWNRRPVHKRINFAQDILIPDPTRALVAENIHKTPNVIF